MKLVRSFSAQVGATTRVATCLALLAAAPSAGDDWSRFRGPNGAGVAEASHLPVEVGPSSHVFWKRDLPVGQSSPVLGGERIFLTALEGERLLTIALDRSTGEILWQRVAPRPRRETLDNRNGPAAPSPVTDGQRVVVFFGDYGLLAYSVDGQELWRRPFGPFTNFYGVGASPILAGNRVILAVDQQRGSFLVALDARSGEQIWRTERPEAKTGHSTPILHHPDGGSEQIVLAGSFFLTGYSAATGEKLWWVSGLSFEMKSTPATEDGVLFINGYGSPLNEEGQSVRLTSFASVLTEHDADHDGRITAEEAPSELVRQWLDFVDLDRDGALDSADWQYFQNALESRNGLLAIRLPKATERGDLTASHVLWRYHRKIPQLPSTIAYRGILWMVDDRGIATSLRARSGEVIAQGRLAGAVDSFYASPVAAEGKIYLLSRSGKLVVLPADGSLTPLAVSDLDDLATATPAIADDRLYVRTRSALFAFGQDAEP